ncbi:MAG TPA: sigma 54-interacting transcriptional regulator [Kofleriaceae bacterium]
MDPATLPPSAGEHAAADDAAVPGVVVVWTQGAPAARVIAGAVLALGRGGGAGLLDDGRVSRQHACVIHAAGGWTVTDLGSQNGTFADGQPVPPHAPVAVERVIRLGDSLVVPRGDVRPYARGVLGVDGFVRGPAMQAVLDEVARAASGGRMLHIRGESGTCKEGVAAAFHAARGGGPLISVNCATIPPAIAERLLFGARRGAYSGAEVDAVGYVQEADGGTLFLDEVAELDLQVQAKLLRVLESSEVLPVGATRPRKVELALCSATHRDLRAMVAAGTLREDLYFRIGRPAVLLPPLRQRPEEIPALIARALASRSPAPAAHVLLVEQCLLRAWPGNVRELMAELRTAAQAAGDRVLASHLAPAAGSAFGAAMPDPAPPAGKKAPVLDDDWRARISDALRSTSGNVTAAARALGLHRTQLRRLIQRHGLAGEITSDDD